MFSCVKRGIQYSLPHRYFGRFSWISICKVSSKLPCSVGPQSVVVLFLTAMGWASDKDHHGWCWIGKSPRAALRGRQWQRFISTASLWELHQLFPRARPICCLPSLFFFSISHSSHMWHLSLECFLPVSTKVSPGPHVQVWCSRLHRCCHDTLTRQMSAYLPTPDLSWLTLPTPVVHD